MRSHNDPPLPTRRSARNLGCALAGLVLLVNGPLLAQNRPIVINGKSCTTSGCHDALVKPKYLHAPTVANACDQCHRETDRTNHEYDLVADLPALCFFCHVELRDKLADATSRPYHHKPVDESKCLDCHNPHASGHRMMLRHDSVVDLCMSCHKEKLSLTGHVHKPIVEQDCLACHRGHDGDNPKLLRKTREDLCMQCHDDKFEAFTALFSVHKPVQDKNCVGCHTPHASPEPKLLARPFSTDLYLPFNDKSYAFCFSCHKPELATQRLTVEDTNFRNGDLNLHFLHVNKASKGRSCRICHLPHSSELPRLIRPMVPFGAWEVSIPFVTTETGGYCGSACHSAKRYDRVTPVDLSQEPRVPASLRTGP